MSKFSWFFLGNPTNKTVIGTGTAHTWGTINSKAPGPNTMIDQLEILSRSQVQFIKLFFAGASLG